MHILLCVKHWMMMRVIRVAGLKAMPSFAIKKHDDLFIFLSDRLLEENEHVRKAARECLRKVAPVFPSGCGKLSTRRELRHENKQHRNDAFSTLQDTSQNWVGAGCLHLDELIREEDVDLRRKEAGNPSNNYRERRKLTDGI